MSVQRLSDDQILCVMDAARITGATRQRLYKWVDQGKLPERILSPKIKSGKVYVRLGDVRELLRTAPRKPIAC